MNSSRLFFLLPILLIFNCIDAVDGTLDPSFNGVGFVTTTIGSFATTVAVQIDGSIIIACESGRGPSSATLVRFNSSGAQDMSFGGTGTVTVPFPVADVIIQPDGNILVCGGNGSQAMVARYTSSGAVDTSFVGGTAAVIGNEFRALMLQSDGKIIAAGNTESVSTTVPLIVRFNTNGTVDVTFASSGITNAAATDIAIQADGRVVIALADSSISPTFKILRYNTDGSLDSSFGSATGTPMPTGIAKSIVIQTDGKCIMGGVDSTSSFFQVARFNTQGVLDLSYNGTGFNSTVTCTLFGDAVLQADGKLIAVGQDTTSTDVQLARYNTNGTIDDSFGTGGTGVVTTPPGSAAAAALQANGYIVIAGNIGSAALIARFVSSPALVATQISSPTAGAVLSAGQSITFTGQAQDPSMVYLLLNGVTQAGTHTDPNNWTITITISAPGIYTARAVSVYQNGDLDIASDPITLTVGPTPPANFTGTITKNVFLNKTECVLQATFPASSNPSTTEYVVAQNGIVLAVIPATQPALTTLNSKFVLNTASSSDTYQFVFCGSCKGNAFSGITVSAVANGATGLPQPLVIVS